MQQFLQIYGRLQSIISDEPVWKLIKYAISSILKIFST